MEKSPPYNILPSSALYEVKIHMIKISGFTLLGVLAIAATTYIYFNRMFSDLAEATLFEEATIPHYL